MRFVLGALGLALAVVLVLFGVQNTQMVRVQFLNFTTGDVSLSLVVVIAAITGAAIAGVFSLSTSIRRTMRDRKLNKEQTALKARALDLAKRVEALEKENAQLRNQTPQPPPIEAKTRKT